MLKEKLKEYITNELGQMGCKNIRFDNGDDNVAVVFFDCDNLISFRKEIPEWSYSGIQFNFKKIQTTDGKYKIEFKKNLTPSANNMAESNLLLGSK